MSSPRPGGPDLLQRPHSPVPHITRGLLTTSHRRVWRARAIGAALWGWAEQEVWWAGIVRYGTNGLERGSLCGWEQLKHLITFGSHGNHFRADPLLTWNPLGIGICTQNGYVASPPRDSVRNGKTGHQHPQQEHPRPMSSTDRFSGTSCTFLA